MSRPRFSIVIPTRERAHTLHFALRTCLAQEFDDYEIIVCDNCSSSATRQVVEQLNSPKINYVRSDVPLAMNDNWELAVSHTSGEFVTVVGDDDGLLRHALSEADRLLRFYHTPVLRWAWNYYNWPDHPSGINADRLIFSAAGECQLVQSRSLFQDLITDPRRFHELPMIYNSFIRRDFLDRVRKRTGRVFKARSPDVYSGFVFADLAREFISVTRPLGICGTSGKSYGHALIAGEANTAGRAKEFVDLLAPSGLTWNAALPHLPKLICAVIAESFAQSRTNFHPHATWTREDRKSLISAIMRDRREHASLTDAEWTDALTRLEHWCDDDPPLMNWFRTQFQCEADLATRPQVTTPQWQTGFGHDRFVMDGRAFGISDIDAAAAFIENLLACRSHPIAIQSLQSSPHRLRDVAEDVIPPVLFRALKASRAAFRRKAS